MLHGTFKVSLLGPVNEISVLYLVGYARKFVHNIYYHHKNKHIIT
jgi:hypothetical protein